MREYEKVENAMQATGDEEGWADGFAAEPVFAHESIFVPSCMLDGDGFGQIIYIRPIVSNCSRESTQYPFSTLDLGPYRSHTATSSSTTTKDSRDRTDQIEK